MTIQIRAAEWKDAEVIAEFNCRLASETESKQLIPEVIRAGVCAVLDDPAKGRYFVACCEGEVMGQLMHTFEWSDWRNGYFWWIQSVYVREEFRGQGVFKALFEHLRKTAIQENVVGLRLYVENHNQQAQEVYNRLGMASGGYQVLEFMLQNRLGSV